MTDADSVTFQVQSLFYQGAYHACIDLATSSSSSSTSASPTTAAQRSLYAARSHIALADAQLPCASKVRGLVAPGTPASDALPAASKALLSLSSFVDAHHTSNDADAEAAIADLDAQLQQLQPSAIEGGADDESQQVKVAAATAKYLAGDAQAALEALGMGRADSKQLECIALGVHILLAINRPDVAQREYQAARSWADDSLLIQLIEASLGLYTGGRASNQAYYVYDELAQNPSIAAAASSASGAAVPSLIGKAVAKLSSGDRQEAAKVLAEVEEQDADNADMLANQVVVYSSLDPQKAQEYASRLRAVHASHPLVRRLDEASNAFDVAASEHAAAVAAAAQG